MGLPVFIKLSLFMAAVFISNIVQALTGFAGVMLSIPPTILLYGPDMAKAVINVICWLVCAYLMVKNREYINKKELGRIILFMLIGMAAGIYLYNIVDARILVPVYGLLIVGVALKNLLLKPSGASLPVWVAILSFSARASSTACLLPAARSWSFTWRRPSGIKIPFVPMWLPSGPC